MKCTVLVICLFFFVAKAANPYAKLINTQWTAANNYVTACIANCGTCCVTNMNIQENGASSAGANVYFHQNTLSRCGATNIGPYSLNFNSIIQQNPLTIYGNIAGGPNTKMQLQFFSNTVGIIFNDTSNAMCTENLDIIGTYNNSNENIYMNKLLIVIVILSIILVEFF